MKKPLMVNVGFSMFVAFCLIGAAEMLSAAESAYPNKPIAFITHSGPGGGMDTMLRRIADIEVRHESRIP